MLRWTQDGLSLYCGFAIQILCSENLGCQVYSSGCIHEPLCGSKFYLESHQLVKSDVNLMTEGWRDILDPMRYLIIGRILPTLLVFLAVLNGKKRKLKFEHYCGGMCVCFEGNKLAKVGQKKKKESRP